MITTEVFECNDKNREAQVERRLEEFHANYTGHVLWRKVAGSGNSLVPAENSTHQHNIVPSSSSELTKNMAGGKVVSGTECFNNYQPTGPQLNELCGREEPLMANYAQGSRSYSGEKRKNTNISSEDEGHHGKTTRLESSSDKPLSCAIPSQHPIAQKAVTSVLMSLVQPYFTTTTTTTRHQRHTCRSITRLTSGTHHQAAVQKRLELVSLAIALSSCCLIMTANVGYCAPVTTPNGKSSATATSKSILVANTSSNDESAGLLAQAAPGIVQKHKEQGMDTLDKMKSLQREALAEAVVDAITRGYENSEKSEASPDDDEVIVLLLRSPESSSSMRRLIKRSGISDQRLAEIQMIRALKKQLERASKLTASETPDQSGVQASS